MGSSERRLDILKTLGDNTRYAIYLELARSPRPLATAEIADTLGLHPNTVRPHLERMRDVGLLEARPDGRGAVGRPQNLYTLAPDAPSLGLEPPVFPMLARMLLELAADAGLDDDVVVAAGRDQGRRLAHSAVGSDRSTAPRRPCIDAAVAMLDELGFDPAAVALWRTKYTELSSRFYQRSSMELGLVAVLGAEHLLGEALQAYQKIPITTFMIASDPYLQRFVNEFTETNQGKAFFASLDHLGAFIFRDFESGKRKTLY